MLPTCTRCRNRRIKCDTSLPACANCARSDLECTFRDGALGANIPRSYIKSLKDRVQDLNSQLALHPHRPSEQRLCLNNDSASFLPAVRSSSFHVLMPGPEKDVYADLSLPTRITKVTFEVLQLPQPDAIEITHEFQDRNDPLPMLSSADRSILTPSAVRFLLGRYDRCIRPQYDVITTDISQHDGINLKKLPDLQQFYVLVACAIAAAHETYRVPNWKACAQVCRDWANEFLTPIILSADGDSLAAVLLLLIYELADPSRGAVWELLDLAIRICLQLGWYRNTQLLENVSSTISCSSFKTTGTSSETTEARLMFVLRDIEGSLRTTFSRPTMLSGSKWPTTYSKDVILLLYERFSQAVYGRYGIYESQNCPFANEVSSLMNDLEMHTVPDPILHEMWLLLLPICVQHRPCVACFQEVDDRLGRGMSTLRKQVIDAASQLMCHTYEEVIAKGKFIPPMIASSRALISGCSIATGISKKWTSPESHMRDLIRCTEILSFFAPHWKGGHKYLHVWRNVTDFLFKKMEGTNSVPTT